MLFSPLDIKIHKKTRRNQVERGSIPVLTKYKCLAKYPQIDERIYLRENTTNRVNMTPEEQQKIKINLQEIADILYKNTPGEKLQDFESVELSVREHLIETVAPEISSFFLLSGWKEFWENKNHKKLCGRNQAFEEASPKAGSKAGKSFESSLGKMLFIISGK